MKNIKRIKYLNQIRPFYNKQLIKVLTGQRRVGKSYLLKQIMEELLKASPNANFLFIDKEKFEFDTLLNSTHLYNYVKQNSREGMNYIFLDEVQEIKEFEKALRSLQSESDYDIYCTGSNSSVFSGELATFLSGRQLEVHVFSLSYNEFLEFNSFSKGKESLMKYLTYGGLPYLCHLPKEDEIIFDYLKNIYATILYRDVLSRNQIRDISFLENLIRFLADNTGSLVSANRISDFMKSQHNSKAVSVIINYLNYLMQSYFIKGVKRQDIQGKRIFESNEKYYFQDLGLRNAISGFKPKDISKIIENAVFNHLSYMGYNIHTGKLNQKEIDFIAEKGGEFIYFQVCYLLSNENVIDREFGNLKSIPDHYPKYVISMDDFPITTSFEGIKHINLLDFLSLESMN